MLESFLVISIIILVSNLLHIKSIRDNVLEANQTKPSKIVSLKQNDEIDFVMLNRSLKNLEYINQFEEYLYGKKDLEFSSEFLQNFYQLKTEAQLTTLNTTQELIHKCA